MQQARRRALLQFPHKPFIGEKYDSTQTQAMDSLTQNTGIDLLINDCQPLTMVVVFAHPAEKAGFMSSDY